MSAPCRAASARAVRALARLRATSPTVGLSCASAILSSLMGCGVMRLQYQVEPAKPRKAPPSLLPRSSREREVANHRRLAHGGIDSFGASPHAASPPETAS